MWPVLLNQLSGGRTSRAGTKIGTTRALNIKRSDKSSAFDKANTALMDEEVDLVEENEWLKFLAQRNPRKFYLLRAL